MQDAVPEKVENLIGADVSTSTYLDGIQAVAST